MIHELGLERHNLTGYFSRDLPPVLTIDPGDSVRFAVPSSGWWVDEGTLMAREHGLASDDARALASVVVDVRVTQIVNGQVGVHAVLRDDAWS